MLRGGSPGGPGTSRAFVAFDLDEASLDVVTRAAASLRASAPPDLGARWTTRGQLHVTVRFLGSVDDVVLERMGEAVRAAGASGLPRSARVEAITGFPAVTHATVLVATLADAAGELASLARTFEEHAVALGLAPESRVYRPHLTLGRLRVPRDLATLAARARVAGSELAFAGLALYRSDRGPDGAKYTALTRAPAP